MALSLNAVKKKNKEKLMALLFFDLYIVVGLALTAYMYFSVHKVDVSVMITDGEQEDADLVEALRDRFDNHFTSSVLLWTFLWPFKLATPV